MRCSRAIAICALVGFVLTSGMQPASAAESVLCGDDIGQRVPVLLVHGIDSNAGMWSTGSPSMSRRIEAIPDISVRTFDYEQHHFDWVTDSNIGPKLAQTIDCLAQKSLAGGGHGKVIVVAHSMGGLAVRYAASQRIDGRSIASELGLVITLGTPHNGAPLATTFGFGWRWYCGLLVGNASDKRQQIRQCEKSAAITALREGSRELRVLPAFPAGVLVRAIAGDETVIIRPFPTWPIAIDLQSDVVVPVRSATAAYTTSGRGDGRFVFKCSIRHYEMYGLFNYQGGECSHNELTTTSYIQQAVVDGVVAYVAHPEPSPHPDSTPMPTEDLSVHVDPDATPTPNSTVVPTPQPSQT